MVAFTVTGPDLAATTSAISLAIVKTWFVLLARLLSLTPLAAWTRLVRIPRLVEVTDTVKLLTLLLARLNSGQPTWPLAFVPPPLARLNVTPGGSVSLKAMAVAALGPLLVTASV